MNGNSAIANSKACSEILVKELRAELLLALRYAKGENANPLLTETHIRASLDKLERLEEAFL